MTYESPVSGRGGKWRDQWCTDEKERRRPTTTTSLTMTATKFPKESDDGS
jgi:hypothetical protein